jgi:hypothetical protein
MIYTVLWYPTAERDLATLWLQAPDQQSVADAADRMDVMLRRDPQMLGESREEDLRILVVDPLAIYFRLDEEDRKVFVTDIWRSR